MRKTYDGGMLNMSADKREEYRRNTGYRLRDFNWEVGDYIAWTDCDGSHFTRHILQIEGIYPYMFMAREVNTGFLYGFPKADGLIQDTVKRIGSRNE